MRDYDLQINGTDHLVAKRSGSSQERQKNREKDRNETTALHIESPPKEKSLYAPNSKTERQKNHAESSSEGTSSG
jgi:hypothetical protein